FVYPSLYGPLARLVGERPAALTALRVLLAAAAMVLPTTLMGGTLPVLGRIVAARTEAFGGGLGRLYGINTLGAVTGAALTGLVLLPRTSASGTLAAAIATNFAIGAAALVADAAARRRVPAGGAHAGAARTAGAVSEAPFSSAGTGPNRKTFPFTGIG